MFDNLRQQSLENAEEVPTASTLAARPKGKPFLGLTPPQRFLLALMLFLNVTVLGCFALVAFEKIALPF
jgi:hypothetical protein